MVKGCVDAKSLMMLGGQTGILEADGDDGKLFILSKSYCNVEKLMIVML